MRITVRNSLPSQQQVAADFLHRAQNASALQRGLNGYMQNLSRSQDLPRGSVTTSNPHPLITTRRTRTVKMGAPKEKHKDKLLPKCSVIYSNSQHGEITNEKEIVYQQPDHCAQGFPIFEDIRRQGKLCDVTLKVKHNLTFFYF